MSLQKYIKENVAKTIQDLESITDRLEEILLYHQEVQDIEKLDYWEKVGAGGYAVALKSTKNDYILRISHAEDDGYNNWEQFLNKDLENIVKMYFYKETEKYIIVLMEKLIPLSYEEKEAMSVFHNIMKVDIPEFLSEVNYDSDLYQLIKESIDTFPMENLTRYVKRGMENVKDNIQDYENMINDLKNALEQYEREVGDYYPDLHFNNLMKTEDGKTYKLIDL